MTPSQIKAFVIACVLLVAVLAVGGIGYRLGSASGRVELAEYKAKVIASTAKASDLATKAERIARETERAHVAALDAVATQYERDKINAQVAHDRLAADLRAGNVRLHQRWQAAIATGELSSAVKSASELDAEARDREGSAAAIIAAADRCDAQVIGLQNVIMADRK